RRPRRRRRGGGGRGRRRWDVVGERADRRRGLRLWGFAATELERSGPERGDEHHGGAPRDRERTPLGGVTPGAGAPRCTGFVGRPHGVPRYSRRYRAPVQRETRSVVALLSSVFAASSAWALLDTVLGKLVFDMTGSELALGLIGLAEFAP